ncbi:MAG TPA: hypothetical protein VM143_07095 [Acidimicrobiales bacterium]|nr:hypothetical protein [Acidimicrobiales bacterium]
MNHPQPPPQQPRKKPPQRRRRSGAKGKGGASGDLWRAVPAVPAPEPIVPASRPSALIRSLGDPPLQGQGAVAEHYLAAVVERAAGLAAALAAAGGLLGSASED